MAGLRPISRLASWDATLTRALTLPADAPTTRPLAYRVAWMGAHGGDSWLWAVIAALLWRRARLEANGDAARRRVDGLAASLIAAAGLTLTLKRCVRRVRPGSGAGLYGGGPDVYSFPSGHAVRMGVITVWATDLSAPWRAAAALLALWVGVSRVRLGIHFVGDVIGGYAIGAALAWLIRRATFHRQKP